MTLSSRE